MEIKKLNVYFFIFLLIGVSLLIFFIVKPFLVPFLIAAILAHFFRPVYSGLLKLTGNKKGISSFLTCLMVALIIIVPIVLVSSLVIQEVRSLIAGVDIPASGGGFNEFVDKINMRLSKLAFLVGLENNQLINEENVGEIARNLSQAILALIQSTYRGIVHFIFVTFIMFFSLFYLLIDGERLVKTIMRLSPLRDKHEQTLIEKFNSIVRATLKGTMLIAILQGSLGALLFTLTGVSSPVLLGILMTISSVIPSVGSGLVWAPVGLIMILLGNFFQGIIILLAGSLVISTIDNFIRPKLVGRDVQMHPLLILFSSLGGIALFGISGFIIGPIFMSLFVSLWDIYSVEFKKQIDSFNL